MFSHGCVRLHWKCINRFTHTPQQLWEFQFFLVFQYCPLSVVFSCINVSGILAGFVYSFLFFCFWWHWEWTHSTTELWPSWRVLTQRISKSMFRELSKHPVFCQVLKFVYKKEAPLFETGLWWASLGEQRGPEAIATASTGANFPTLQFTNCMHLGWWRRFFLNRILFLIWKHQRHVFMISKSSA